MVLPRVKDRLFGYEVVLVLHSPRVDDPSILRQEVVVDLPSAVSDNFMRRTGWTEKPLEI